MTAMTVRPSLADLGGQPSDGDLDAIAALSTTAYGRSILEAADAAAGRTLLGAQAALTTSPAYTQTYAGVSRTVPVAAASSPGGYAGGLNGFNTSAQAQNLWNAVVNLITDVGAVRDVLNQVIDDLQADGILG